MSWEVAARVGLPVWKQENDDAPAFVRDTIYKEPGDTISKKEMEDARQTPADIKNMVDAGTIKEVK